MNATVPAGLRYSVMFIAGSSWPGSLPPAPRPRALLKSFPAMKLRPARLAGRASDTRTYTTSRRSLETGHLNNVSRLFGCGGLVFHVDDLDPAIHFRDRPA